MPPPPPKNGPTPESAPNATARRHVARERRRGVEARARTSHVVFATVARAHGVVDAGRRGARARGILGTRARDVDEGARGRARGA